MPDKERQMRFQKPVIRRVTLLVFTLLLVLLTALAGIHKGISQASINKIPASASQPCAPLPTPSGSIVRISSVNDLVNAVNSASSGTTILIADGTYLLNGAYLRIDTPNITLRAESGKREAVILDGNYQTTEIFQIVASNVTIADVTLRRAYDHPGMSCPQIVRT